MPDLEPVGRYYNKNPEPFPHKQFRFPELLQNHYDNVVAKKKFPLLLPLLLLFHQRKKIVPRSPPSKSLAVAIIAMAIVVVIPVPIRYFQTLTFTLSPSY